MHITGYFPVSFFLEFPMAIRDYCLEISNGIFFFSCQKTLLQNFTFPQIFAIFRNVPFLLDISVWLQSYFLFFCKQNPFFQNPIFFKNPFFSIKSRFFFQIFLFSFKKNTYWGKDPIF